MTSKPAAAPRPQAERTADDLMADVASNALVMYAGGCDTDAEMSWRPGKTGRASAIALQLKGFHTLLP